MKKIHIGSRNSPLAMVQTRLACGLMQKQAPACEYHIQGIETKGDQVLDVALSDIGGKGLFAKELDQALLGRVIDCAVHSLKDLETHLPDNIVIAAVLPRGMPHDVMLGTSQAIADLPKGATIGSCSPRRLAQIRAVRKDLQARVMRGNVQTRLDKLARGECDVTLLALCGLQRLGVELAEIPHHILSLDEMIPACGQGAIAVTCRADDERMIAHLRNIDDPTTRLCITAERATLAGIGGDCHTPIGVHAQKEANTLRLQGVYVLGEEMEHAEVTASDIDSDVAVDLGTELAKRLRKEA
ncbi:MAG: hydroxymethylbilane synthase [Pseudomonadota bacterium]